MRISDWSSDVCSSDVCASVITTCRPSPAPCPRDPRTRARPPWGSSPNGQDRVRAWGAQRLEPRCRASGRRTMVVIVAQLSYIEHGSQEFLMAATAFVRARIDETLKDEAAAVLAELGLTVSDVVRMTLTRVAKDHALPFEDRKSTRLNSSH